MYSSPGNKVDVDSVVSSIKVLKQQLDADEIAPLVEVMEAIAAAPEDAALLDKLANVFDGLGVYQGAVLTYAPCLTVLLTDDPFDSSS